MGRAKKQTFRSNPFHVMKKICSIPIRSVSWRRSVLIHSVPCRNPFPAMKSFPFLEHNPFRAMKCVLFRKTRQHPFRSVPCTFLIFFAPPKVTRLCVGSRSFLILGAVVCRSCRRRTAAYCCSLLLCSFQMSSICVAP